MSVSVGRCWTREREGKGVVAEFGGRRLGIFFWVCLWVWFFFMLDPIKRVSVFVTVSLSLKLCVGCCSCLYDVDNGGGLGGLALK